MAPRKPKNLAPSAATEPKNLTLSDLNKYASKLDEQKTIYVLDGKYKVSIFKTFKDTELQKLTAEYLQHISELSQRKNVTLETLLSVEHLVYAMACKYFTNLPMNITSLDELIAITHNLLNLGIAEQLFSGDPERGFSSTEIEKLNKSLNKASESIGQIAGEIAITESLNSIQAHKTHSEDSKIDESNGK